MNAVDYLAACLCVFVTLILIAVASGVMWIVYGLILSSVNMTRNLKTASMSDDELRAEALRIAEAEEEAWHHIPTPPQGVQLTHQNGVPLERTGFQRPS